jgi:hypothetical protein
VNVDVLLINNTKNELPMIFEPFGIIVYPAILAVNLPYQIANWYSSSMFILSESNLRGTHGTNPR